MSADDTLSGYKKEVVAGLLTTSGMGVHLLLGAVCKDAANNGDEKVTDCLLFDVVI